VQTPVNIDGYVPIFRNLAVLMGCPIMIGGQPVEPDVLMSPDAFLPVILFDAENRWKSSVPAIGQMMSLREHPEATFQVAVDKIDVPFISVALFMTVDTFMREKVENRIVLDPLIDRWFREEKSWRPLLRPSAS